MGAKAIRPSRASPVSGGGLLGWIRSRSLWVLPVGSGCCVHSIEAARSSPYDLARWGVQFCTDPVHADVLLVFGRVGLKMIPCIRSLYERMVAPRWVIAAGACACSGGAHDTYASVQGVDRCLPVDLYVPGCPVTPEDLIDAVRTIQGRGAAAARSMGSR